MTGSTQDHLLREVLARQAETQESPGYDPAAIAVRARTRRRRQRALAGGAAMALSSSWAPGVLVGEASALATLLARHRPAGPRSTECLFRPDSIRAVHPVLRSRAPSDQEVRRPPRRRRGVRHPLHTGVPGHRYLWFHEGRR